MKREGSGGGRVCEEGGEWRGEATKQQIDVNAAKAKQQVVSECEKSVNRGYYTNTLKHAHTDSLTHSRTPSFTPSFEGTPHLEKTFFGGLKLSNGHRNLIIRQVNACGIFLIHLGAIVLLLVGLWGYFRVHCGQICQ